MKISYVKPCTQVLLMEIQQMIAATIESDETRSIKQETDVTSPLPTGVGETTESENGLSTNGQAGEVAPGIGSTRSKTGMIWDEW